MYSGSLGAAVEPRLLVPAEWFSVGLEVRRLTSSEVASSMLVVFLVLRLINLPSRETSTCDEKQY